tara:strand:- start:4098 stop:4298 length:201 start_codon:yes stop_codon:yes gene_type:complete
MNIKDSKSKPLKGGNYWQNYTNVGEKPSLDTPGTFKYNENKFKKSLYDILGIRLYEDKKDLRNRYG